MEKGILRIMKTKWLLKTRLAIIILAISVCVLEFNSMISFEMAEILLIPIIFFSCFCCNKIREATKDKYLLKNDKINY